MNDLGRRTLQKVTWRLVPFLGGLYAFHIIDQANEGGIFAPKIVGSFGVGPMAGVMAWGVLMAMLSWWCIERRASAASKA
jgi:hypothetical protein